MVSCFVVDLWRPIFHPWSLILNAYNSSFYSIRLIRYQLAAILSCLAFIKTLYTTFRILPLVRRRGPSKFLCAPLHQHCLRIFFYACRLKTVVKCTESWAALRLGLQLSDGPNLRFYLDTLRSIGFWHGGQKFECGPKMMFTKESGP